MDPPAFLADSMLGRLARTLRLLGFSVEYRRDAADDALLEDVGARVLLTRDVALAERARRAGKRVALVREIDHVAQAQEVVEDLGLDVDPARVLTRCALCDAALREASAEERRGAPWGARPPFAWCEACGKLYWEGSHGPRIRALAERLRRR